MEKKEEQFKRNLTNQTLFQKFSNQTNFIKKQWIYFVFII